MTGPGQAPDPTPTVIRNVRALRRGHGWTGEQLAQRLRDSGCRVSRATLSEVENGRRKISVAELFALAHVFGVSVQRLTEGPACATCDDSPPAGYACLKCGKEGRP